ncbi:MAG: HEAT repeat domain-containing protein [Melioribacteraceae bacterium]|nr:HEAT repeat domain-containing protein [Melioribacteraceae bacterium]
MKHFITFLIFVVVTSAQFTPDDIELAKTTFLREFDKNIIHQYLKSGDEQKVKATLLSIAQSDDTTFIDKVTKLDFHKYPELISFALGQLGPNNKSAVYLKEILFADPKGNSRYLFEAIGKVGSENDLLECVKFQSETNLPGFAYAVYNFHLRGIKDESKNDIQILLNNLKEKKDEEKLFASLFALYRIAADKVNPTSLENILSKEYNSSTKLYALGILRKQQKFSFSFSLLKELISDRDWSVRCEAARTVCYYPYETMDELDEFLNFLSDDNPSVSRTAAQSLPEINFANDSLKKDLIEDLRFYIVNDELTENVRGEILLTLQKWQPGKTRNLYFGVPMHDNSKLYLSITGQQ